MRAFLVIVLLLLAGCTGQVKDPVEPPDGWTSGEAGNLTRRFVASSSSTPNVVYTPAYSIQEGNCFETSGVDMTDVPRARFTLRWDNTTPAYDELRLVAHGQQAVGGPPLRLVLYNLTTEGTVRLHVMPPLDAGAIVGLPVRLNFDIAYSTDSRADPTVRRCTEPLDAAVGPVQRGRGLLAD